MCVKAGNEVLKQGMKKIAMDHCEEGHRNQFCQFAHDGATLKNRDEHQAMGIQFSDEDGEHDDVITLAFRKPISHKADNVAMLAKEIVLDFFVANFWIYFLL